MLTMDDAYKRALTLIQGQQTVGVVELVQQFDKERAAAVTAIEAYQRERDALQKEVLELRRYVTELADHINRMHDLIHHALKAIP